MLADQAQEHAQAQAQHEACQQNIERAKRQSALEAQQAAADYELALRIQREERTAYEKREMEAEQARTSQLAVDELARLLDNQKAEEERAARESEDLNRQYAKLKAATPKPPPVAPTENTPSPPKGFFNMTETMASQPQTHYVGPSFLAEGYDRPAELHTRHPRLLPETPPPHRPRNPFQPGRIYPEDAF